VRLITCVHTIEVGDSVLKMMMDSWWEVDYAKSGRSKCKNCKQTINEGEPRIGISSEQEDHGGGPGYGGRYIVIKLEVELW
jgi:hypothetical protein